MGQTSVDLRTDDTARVECLRLQRTAFECVSSLSRNSLFQDTNNHHSIVTFLYHHHIVSQVIVVFVPYLVITKNKFNA